mgnify:FL=1
MAGLIVATLPAGFGMGALTADRLLPAKWATAGRELTGVAICIAALAGLLAAQADIRVDAPLLGLLGVGLGVFIPANNAAIMTAVPARAAALAGGLVNTARAVGTAAATAIVALTLTAGSGRLTAATLLAVAAALAILTLRGRARA